MSYTRSQIDELLKTNDRAVLKGIVRLNTFQTVDEQSSQQTKYTNGVGFNGCYAPIGTRLADKVSRGFILSKKEIELARKICLKHSRQLVDYANRDK